MLEAKREVVKTEIRRDPRRSDQLIADSCSSTMRTVCSYRKEMVASGEIPDIAVSERICRPRPAKYRKRHQRGFQLSKRALRNSRDLERREDLARREEALRQRLHGGRR